MSPDLDQQLLASIGGARGEIARRHRDRIALEAIKSQHLNKVIAQKWAAVIGHGAEALQSKGDTLRYTNLAIALLQEARDAALELEGPEEAA